ncbi:MAG: MBOAT family O-acyltransferase, partial [Sedimentisphaerales bacterium]|nr:MBOAT family O-acyltransferase [Sedimentisphaerales bacterium]
MARSDRNKLKLSIMAISLVVNMSVLGFFKYFVFFQENLNYVIRAFGAEVLPVLKVAWPVGVSFYTFKILSFMVDVYRGAPPARSFFDFACYVSFFPQILSGPIQRYGTIDAKSQQVPAFAEQLVCRTHNLDKFSYGAALFILGFAKKILLANVVAKVANAVFAAAAPGSIDAWFGAVAYTFQLYFDFSAYSEMAIGLGLMLGFECSRNFNAPYLSNSITDFWRRWHISLSSWFRDYLYISLGGSRKGIGRSYFNLVIVFLLCGLWHGANWTFVVWGVYHGILLVVERFIGRKAFYYALPRQVQVLLTFLLIMVGWVFFRSATISDAWQYLTVMFTMSKAQGGSVLLSSEIYTQGSVLIMVICAFLAFQPLQAFDWAKTITWPKVLILIVLLCVSLMTMFAQSFSSFLYFQF